MKYASFFFACLMVLPTFADDLETLHQQQDFCREVTRSGEVSRAAEVGALLLDARTQTVACTALANLPNRAGLPVLREALGKAECPQCLAGIVQTLADLQDTDSVETLKAMLNNASTDLSVKVALLKSLGRLGQTDVILPYLRSEENALQRAAADGMLFAARRLPKADADRCYQAIIDANADKGAVKIAQRNRDNVTLAPADVLGEDPNAEFRQPVPTQKDLENLLKSLTQETRTTPETVAKIAKLCRRLADRVGALVVLETFYKDQPTVVVDIAAKMGIAESLVILEKYAQSDNDALVNAATKYLGDWPTYDAAPVLIRLAQTHPTQKYRIRLLRGYIRILKRWDIAALEKKQMCQTVLAVAEREEEKAMVRPILNGLNAGMPETQLFNGKDFTGWDGRKDIFQIVKGAVYGGSLEKPLDRNEFLTTNGRYRNFYFRLEAKITGDGGNAGVQFRSERIPNHNEMIGYQADMTADGAYWGNLYDESRRKTFLQKADPAVVKAILKPNDWNRYEILCDGPLVKIFLNGVQTVEYTETKEGIPQEGLIGLQIHSGGPAQSAYRNVFITVKD